MATKKKLDRGKEVRRLARERIGTTPPAQVFQPKTKRKRPKHKKQDVIDTE